MGGRKISFKGGEKHVVVFYRNPQEILIPVIHIRTDLTPRKGDFIKFDVAGERHEVLEASLDLFKNRVEVVIAEPREGEYVA